MRISQIVTNSLIVISKKSLLLPSSTQRVLSHKLLTNVGGAIGNTSGDLTALHLSVFILNIFHHCGEDRGMRAHCRLQSVSSLDQSDSEPAWEGGGPVEPGEPSISAGFLELQMTR